MPTASFWIGLAVGYKLGRKSGSGLNVNVTLFKSLVRVEVDGEVHEAPVESIPAEFRQIILEHKDDAELWQEQMDRSVEERRRKALSESEWNDVAKK